MVVIQLDVNQENVNRMREEFQDSVCNKAAGIAALFQRIRWKHISFVIDTEPKPSKRPRLSSYRVYVPDAAKHQRYFNQNILPLLGDLFITTPCKIQANFYMKTPESFTKTQKMLAEMRIIRPWTNIGDVDNLCKTLYDQMQPNEKRGHVGIMENDCLIIESHENKYYSMTPRTEVTISYMGKIPDELKRVLRLD